MAYMHIWSRVFALRTLTLLSILSILSSVTSYRAERMLRVVTGSNVRFRVGSSSGTRGPRRSLSHCPPLMSVSGGKQFSSRKMCCRPARARSRSIVERDALSPPNLGARHTPRSNLDLLLATPESFGVLKICLGDLCPAVLLSANADRYNKYYGFPSRPPTTPTSRRDIPSTSNIESNRKSSHGDCRPS